ncbi:MAG: hypothetical protein CL561_08570 [Alphaproteobacteria bacterium]|nr:hypothetical protein [Alphaproteobacteria bacterium]|tara:strand:- start:1500 stop:2087 length:588 start_codon:yes stop_codon:yes gene_type:complete
MTARKLYRKFCVILICIMVIGYSAQYQLVTKVTQKMGPDANFRYFATTVNGRLAPMRSLHQATLSDEKLVKWAEAAVLKALSFDYTNYRDNLKSASTNFTRTGWESFTIMLERKSILEVVRERKRQSAAVISGQSKLLKKSSDNGRLKYEVTVPIIHEVYNGKRGVNVHMVIVRTPKLEAPDGLGIAVWRYEAAE